MAFERQVKIVFEKLKNLTAVTTTRKGRHQVMRHLSLERWEKKPVQAS